MSDTEKYRKMASQAMIKAARRLRQRQTSAESRLWLCLRNKRLNGIKFRRQHPVANTYFVVDFFAHQHGLIVELDGEVHQYQCEADRERQRILEEEGYQVLRFSNDDVHKNLEGVLTMIVQTVTMVQEA